MSNVRMAPCGDERVNVGRGEGRDDVGTLPLPPTGACFTSLLLLSYVFMLLLSYVNFESCLNVDSFFRSLSSSADLGILSVAEWQFSAFSLPFSSLGIWLEVKGWSRGGEARPQYGSTP